ncbi:hypothetical protein CKA32_006076 [Geitlerinema sp. FC II]|nr:hypothetical protein CKA32_006076 [Geitlerinema sp. FC II]
MIVLAVLGGCSYQSVLKESNNLAAKIEDILPNEDHTND